MAIPTQEDVRILTMHAQGPCVSLYMPTHRAGKETRQDPIRLKNLLTQAQQQLVEAGMRSSEVHDLLQPAQILLDDGMFWQYQSDSLALFCAPEFFQIYLLPLDIAELVIVAGRFHIKPLLSLFTTNGRFFILALSQHAVRLLQGSRFSVEEVPLHNVPTSMAEALQYDDPEKQTQFFTGTAGSTPAGGKRPAVVYGTGTLADEDKKDLLRYFHYVDKGIYTEVLHDEHAPLILAGVEYLLPIYREANSYPHLLDEGITGNPDILRPDELHGQAWKIVEPYFLQDQDLAAERYQQALAHGQATRRIEDIVPAAYYGRVDALFVTVGQQQWGAFDPQNNQVIFHQDRRSDSEDLLDLMAIHTFLNSGTVYAVDQAAMPDIAPVVASLRY